jgi:hypothetical protein
MNAVKTYHISTLSVTRLIYMVDLEQNKSLKIPKASLEAVNRRRKDNTTVDQRTNNE